MRASVFVCLLGQSCQIVLVSFFHAYEFVCANSNHGEIISYSHAHNLNLQDKRNKSNRQNKSRSDIFIFFLFCFFFLTHNLTALHMIWAIFSVITSISYSRWFPQSSQAQCACMRVCLFVYSLLSATNYRYYCCFYFCVHSF